LCPDLLVEGANCRFEHRSMRGLTRERQIRHSPGPGQLERRPSCLPASFLGRGVSSGAILGVAIRLL
jgi:hypothetical protein